MSGVQLGRDNLTIIIGGTIPSGSIQSPVTPGRSASEAQGAGCEAPVALTPCPSPEYGRGEENALTPCPSPEYRRGEKNALTLCPSPEHRRGEPELPPLATQAANLFQSVVAFVGDGCGIVDDATYRRRLEICSTCDRRTGKRCTACGCWINVKARGRAFRCPIGRWQ
jgi:hypothetical protein